MVTTLTTATRTRKARKTDEQRKHEHFLKLAVLVRQGRIHRKMVDGHDEHTFADGEHVDFYESSTYAGYAYMVVFGVQGYECGCESYEHRHSCPHTMDAATRASARYHEAQRQAEMAVAAQVAPLVVGPEFAADMPAHVEDETSATADPWTDENYDPFAGMTASERQMAYRTMYPDDFAA